MKKSGFKIAKGELLEYLGGNNDIVIPDGVTSIADEAFAENLSLTSVTFPASVKWIGDMAFRCCSNITEFKVDENNEFLCAIDGDLYTKDGTELINYAQGKNDISFVVREGVTYIRNVVFKYCENLEQVSIPNTVKRIECAAFRGCTNLRDIYIPDSVENIFYDAFWGCEKLTIHAHKGSYAEEYAKENNIPFVATE